jgi:folate-binding protein YgfZ
MNGLLLHPFHESHGARFFELKGQEAVSDYGDSSREYKALRESAALMDLSFRGRLCLVGADAQKFLNGQVTNNLKDLKVGQGCYAALVSAKGKMQSDLNVRRLENEWLLDFEPGLSAAIKERLEKFVVAEDVQIIDVAPLYGLLRVAGPEAAKIASAVVKEIPALPLEIKKAQSESFGEYYIAFQPGPPEPAFDFFAPVESIGRLAQALVDSGCALCGWQALETARIESTAPRFGADIDESNLPPEAGLETRAISYSKGCYIGQEVIARIRTYGQVAKTLRGLKFDSTAAKLPVKGAKLFHGDKEVGYVTSATASPRCRSNIALAYVRKEANAVGTELLVEIDDAKIPARIQTIPFQPF